MKFLYMQYPAKSKFLNGLDFLKDFSFKALENEGLCSVFSNAFLFDLYGGAF